jgi:hypothetical protein
MEGGPIVTANVMHFHNTAENSAAVAAKFMTHFVADMIYPLPTSQAINRVTVTKLDGSSASYTISTGSAGKWKGTLSGDVAPAVCAVVKFNTIFRGRSATGRAYIGPAAESAGTNGFLGSTVPGSMATAWSTFQTAMVGDDCPQVVASYLHSTAATVLQYSVRNAFATMRLRQSRLA